MFSDFLLLVPVAAIALVLFFRRTRSDTATEDGPPPNAIVVDGSNVMHWGGDPSAKVLRKVVKALEDRGLAPIVFFDANVGYVLDDHYYDERKLANVIGVAQSHICVVNKGVVADEAILSFAGDHGLRVVSNDQYRDWRVRFPHAGQKGRMLRGSYRDGSVIWRGKL